MNLDELQAIAGAATPGPWKAIGGKCLAGVVAPNCQIYLHDARPDMFISLPRWQATAAHIAAFDPPTVLRLIAVARAAQDALTSLHELLEDMEHHAHDCGESGCPVRHAERNETALRQSLEGVEL